MATVLDLMRGKPIATALTHGYAYIITTTLTADTWYTVSTNYKGFAGLWLNDEYVGCFIKGKVTFRSSAPLAGCDIVIKVLDTGEPLRWIKLEVGEHVTVWVPAAIDIITLSQIDRTLPYFPEDGVLKVLRFYDRGLSDAEMMQNWNAGYGENYAKTGLVFDGDFVGEGEVLPDKSGEGNDAGIVGGEWLDVTATMPPVPAPLAARVIRIVRQRKDPGQTQIELGNFRPVQSGRIDDIERRVKRTDGRSGVWDRAKAFDMDGRLPASVLDGTIDAVQNQIKAGGGEVLLDEEGFRVLDTDDPETALSKIHGVARDGEAALVLGKRDSPLDAWVERVGMTSDGFQLFGEEIVGGVIRGDILHIGPDTTYQAAEQLTWEPYKDMAWQEIINEGEQSGAS